MTDQHPITPPPELVLQWRVEAANRQYVSLEFDEYIAEEAAQWGADQELEACCDLLTHEWGNGHGDRLHRLRRPKPPSLKEQALEGLTRLLSTGEFFSNQMKDLDTIRRALEGLPND